MKVLIKLILLSLLFTYFSLQAKEVSLESKVTSLYVSFFNRAADQDGLSYWNHLGQSAEARGENSINTLKQLAAGFATHPTFSTTYSHMNNEEFIQTIYQNSLGKKGDSTGVSYWSGLLESGISRSDVVAEFMNASLTADITAENFPTLSAEELAIAVERQNLISNKVEVATYFTNELNDKTNVTDSQNPENDLAYLASIKIIKDVDVDRTNATLAKGKLDQIKNETDPIQKIIDDWDNITLLNNDIFTPTTSSMKSCIVDVISKNASGTDSSICIEEYPENLCTQKTANDDAEYWNKSYMLDSQCVDLGFETSTLELINENSTQYDSYTKYTTTSQYIDAQTDSLFPIIDVETLINNPPVNKIETVSNDATLSIKPTEDIVEIAATSLVSEDNNTLILIQALDTNDIGKPLFVDGEFKGLVDTLNGTTVVLKEAQNITEVYDNLDIEVNADEIIQSLQRAINNGKIKGQYDYLNRAPLKISIVKDKKRSLSNEPILRMEFPEGYKIPIKPRALSCSTLSLECDFTLNSVIEDKKNLSVTTDSEDSIIFTTKGSYIEYNIGTYLKFYYNKNAFSSDELAFTFAQNVGFTSVLEFKISAEEKSLSKTISFEKNFQPIGNFEIEIIHPKSHLLQTSVIVAPTITLGIEGKLSGSISYKTSIGRTGEIRVAYDNRDDTDELLSTIKDTSDRLGEDAFNVELEASTNAYCYPNMTFIPNLKLFRVKYPITLVELRSGIKLDNTLSGKVAKGFIALEDKVLTNDNSEVSVTSTISGLAQGKWSAKIGEDIVFYESEEFTDILKTNEYKIFEWKMQVLSDPKIVVKNDDVNQYIKKLSFEYDDSTIKEKINYYYTLSDKDDTSTDIDVTNLNNYQRYNYSSQDIELSENTIVKVVAVLNNADVSESIWSFGQSVSNQVTQEISNVIEPTISPSSSSFEELLSISITQPQGYDIYYKLNDMEPVLYDGPIDLISSTNITAYASTELNEVKVLSSEVSESYTLCSEGSKLENGGCVNIDGTVDNDKNGESNEYGIKPYCPTEEPDLGYDFGISFAMTLDGTVLASTLGHPIYYTQWNSEAEPSYVLCQYHDGKLYQEKPGSYGETNGYELWYFPGTEQEQWISSYKNGKLEGISLSFYNNGQLNQESQYVNDLREGKLTFYNEDGSLSFIQNYLNGLLHGEAISYYSDETTDCSLYEGGNYIGPCE